MTPKLNSRAAIKKYLRNIARNTRARIPLWTVIDTWTCDLLDKAADEIEKLEKKPRSRR